MMLLEIALVAGSVVLFAILSAYVRGCERV